METIKNYLDNMFASLPKTARIADIKNELLANMEEKYNELKKLGKSENEAIGIVISEFGNIDELINELGLRSENSAVNAKPVVNREEVEAYLSAKNKIGRQVGIGVFLCILAPALLILLTVLSDRIFGFTESAIDVGGMLGVIVLLVMIAIAVGIFIYSGMGFERYKYMEEGVTLSGSLEAELRQRYDRFLPSFYLRLIIGVCLIILSPITIFVTYLINDTMNELSVVFLLLIVAFAVLLFISSGTIKESFERLLQIGDYTVKKKENDRVIGAVASIVWPLAVIIFLVSGLVYDQWRICWIIFPITGILFGMFSAAYYNIKGNHEA
jgi:hypothetical protein